MCDEGKSDEKEKPKDRFQAEKEKSHFSIFDVKKSHSPQGFSVFIYVMSS